MSSQSIPFIYSETLHKLLVRAGIFMLLQPAE
jgi:hypothetical protein